MNKPTAKIIALDPKNIRGRARRWQDTKADPIFLLAALFVICLICFGTGVLVGYASTHVPLSEVSQ
ncbi:MAG TPA: hypothetical protein VGP89_06345 [Candidatus Angelobacter sp.]|jgi:hypothetical protein|nr:hypothetical protein [Candidatus Angelobacter sp.]